MIFNYNRVLRIASAPTELVRFGGLNAPSVAYAAFSPEFHWDEEEEVFFGGQFWNGRARDLVEQAKGPFVNPAEMPMPSEWAVVERLQENRRYRHGFRSIRACSGTQACSALAGLRRRSATWRVDTRSCRCAISS
jgi:hypothetical protein